MFFLGNSRWFPYHVSFMKSASEVAIICPLTGPTIHTGDLWVGKTKRKLAVAVSLYVSCKSALCDVVKTKGIFTPSVSDKLLL